MSRAFTKERDDDPGPILSAAPRGTYYVTSVTLKQLPEDDERRARAEMVDVDRNVVGFGASVTVSDERDRKSSYTIVNDEDAAPAKALIGISSPLAQALLGKRASAEAVWHRPVGDAKLKIVAIDYR